MKEVTKYHQENDLNKLVETVNNHNLTSSAIFLLEKLIKKNISVPEYETKIKNCLDLFYTLTGVKYNSAKRGFIYLENEFEGVPLIFLRRAFTVAIVRNVANISNYRLSKLYLGIGSARLQFILHKHSSEMKLINSKEESLEYSKIYSKVLKLVNNIFQ